MTPLLAILTAAIAVATPPAGGGPAMLTPVSERTLPLEEACDVRWADPEHVLVADRHRGIIKAAVTGDEKPSWLGEWPEPKGAGTAYTYVASSENAFLASDVVFSFRWREGRPGKLHREIMEYIADVDLDGDRVLLLGLRRNDDGKMGTDGGQAWLGSLSGGERSLRVILPYRDMQAISNCGLFGLGSVRFLGDGSFLIVPGAEPGIYRFSKDGKLQRKWETDVLGLDAPCGSFSREQDSMYGTSPPARQEWVNRYRVVDDILDTPSGPAVIARSMTAKGPHWDLIFLGDDGSTSERPLPVSSPSPWAHIAAATRDDRVALLIGDRLRSRPDGATPRLVTLRWTRP